MEDLMGAIQWISDWFAGDGEAGFWESVTAEAVIVWFKIKIKAAQFAWGVAEQVIASIGISAAVNSAWAAIDSTVMAYMTFFKIPDAINVLISARVTRVVMTFLKII